MTRARFLLKNNSKACAACLSSEELHSSTYRTFHLRLLEAQEDRSSETDVPATLTFQHTRANCNALRRKDATVTL